MPPEHELHPHSALSFIGVPTETSWQFKGMLNKNIVALRPKKKLIENVTAHYTLQISTGLFSTALQSVFWG